MIDYKVGNLFDSKADALAHGCNTVGKMNAGIAKEFKQRFPDMHTEYVRLCKANLFVPGEGYLFRNPQKPHVINLATQADGPAQFTYVESSLKWLAASYEKLELRSVAMPRIASGLGGLNEGDVESLIRRHFEKTNLDVEVWSLSD